MAAQRALRNQPRLRGRSLPALVAVSACLFLACQQPARCGWEREQ